MAESQEKVPNTDLCLQFQSTVEEYLIRHQSILDIISKLQESTGRINRALIKSVTACGCIKIHASKMNIPNNISLTELKNHIDNHLEGALCESCRDVVEEELGKALFYLTSLCTTLGLSLGEVMTKELNRVTALGIFSLR